MLNFLTAISIASLIQQNHNIESLWPLSFTMSDETRLLILAEENHMIRRIGNTAFILQIDLLPFLALNYFLVSPLPNILKVQFNHPYPPQNTHSPPPPIHT